MMVSAAVLNSRAEWRSEVSEMNRISPMIEDMGARMGRWTSGGSPAVTNASFSLTTWRAM